MEELDKLKQEYCELQNKLSDPGFFKSAEFQEVSKRFSELQKIIKKQEEIEGLEKKLRESQTMLEDREMKNLAQDDINVLDKKLETERANLEKILRGDVEKESINEAIMEIRAGTGGEEAALFAVNLLRMYLKFAENNGWQTTVLSANPTEIGGYKEITFVIRGNGVFSKLKYEAGVHRVQRIPETEKSGRIHTSTVSIAVLPKAKKADLEIRPEDIRVETYKASGPGGQYVNKRESAIRITHIATGLAVTSQTARTQSQNREYAMEILRSQLLARKIEEEESKIRAERKAQVGSAERAEKIRTYNFPQDRITDHRISKSWHNIESILDGNLETIVNALENSKS